MKTKILSLVLLTTLVLTMLASCGAKLSGTYKSTEVFGSYTAYEFSGSKVTVKVFVAGELAAEVEGKYKISGDEITFEFEDEKGGDYDGTFTYSEEDGVLKIGSLIKLTKEK